MGAAGRYGERHAAEHHDFESHIRRIGGDPGDRTEGKFRRKTDAFRPALCQKARCGAVIDIDQGADEVPTTVDQADGGEVVDLDGVVGCLDQLFQATAFALQRDECQRREGDGFPRPFQAFHHICQLRLDEMLPFGAHGLAENHAIHRCFVRDLEIEVAPFRAVPEIVDGSQCQFAHAHLQRFS